MKFLFSPYLVLSPWEIRRLKSETHRSRAQVIEAEERISKLERMKLEMEVHYAGEKRRLEEALNEEREKVFPNFSYTVNWYTFLILFLLYFV